MSWEKEHEFKMALDQARKITKAIKYDDTVGEIMVQIEMLAEKFPGVNMRDLEWKMDEVREAKNALESAVYELEEPFEEAMRNASYDDEEDEELTEISDRFEKDFSDIFKDIEDRVKARKQTPDHSKTQAHQDKTKKIPRQDKYKDDYKKDTFESKSSILEGIVSKLDEKCPHCGGELVSEELMNEKKDACYRKVKSRYKVWPSAYASGALVKCRKVGASNWGNKSKKK